MALLARTIRESRRMVKRNIKPNVQRMGELKCSLRPYSVANQLNILIRVGTAIIMVAEVK